MKKTRQLHYSLRSYFVVLFIGILAVTCLLGLLLLAFLKELVGIKAGLVFWIALYTFFIMCMGGLMMWQGSIHLTKPISDLNEAVKRVSSGDFSVKISRKAYPKDQGLYHNEIDELSQNFNQMAEDLQTIAQLRQDFISNVSHELKTPVASLAGISELLLEDQLSNEEEADLLDIMQAETMRLSRLCDDILNLSRLDKQENISPSPVRIDEQLRQAVILLTEKWKDKAISLDYNSQSLTLLTEADLTMRVWLNILDNAIKYSPQQVSLKISLEDRKDGALVTIKDKGYGISEQAQRRIFEQFYQSDHSHLQEGNGLGLAIVKKIVDLLGGQIKVDSQLNQGTSFAIYLPNLKT